MAQDPHHSVSSLEIAAGLARRWRSDCRAVKAIFRQRLLEIGPATASPRAPARAILELRKIKPCRWPPLRRLNWSLPRSLWLPLAVAAGCASIADWLFYDWPVGISLALFLAVLGVAAMLATASAQRARCKWG